MLSLTRSASQGHPLPESRIQIDARFWVWVTDIRHSPKAVNLELSSLTEGFPVMRVELKMFQEIGFAGTTIRLARVSGNKCVLRFDAPTDIIILREELLVHEQGR